ncbi:DUF4856 domain-containing protein [Pseudoalteromonas sp. DL2-H2.2]|uniref:DUF4856 domain-containing protein n=1 Tax=Pseudoalteromonas sp. DL2-H2.2 TaxID=2908889 RepID=UPI001F2C5EE6|nr:DUF4856 domain-containing protein [Pseudoalteromonas sp. DL2-H2.2]MCF2907999.1 DUF4856 domain-containing protein [Pseudoalteromonas sp. DL2-H2.2]
MIFKKSLLATSILVATLGLTACGGSSSNDNNNNNNNNNGQTPDQTTNAKPTSVEPQNSNGEKVTTVKENMVAVEIGKLVATDSDDTTHKFSAPSDDRFEIKDGDILALKAGQYLNYELEPQVTMTVSVEDGQNDPVTLSFTLNVEDEMDYDFISRFEEGKSSVAYSGQIARHVLIKELFNYIGGGQFEADAENTNATKEALITELNKFYAVSEQDYNSFWEDRELTVVTEPAAQTRLTDISSHKNLQDKIAGNDRGGQDKEGWTDEGDFVGWPVDTTQNAGLDDEEKTPIPDLVVQQLFEQLAERAFEQAIGPKNIEIENIYVTADGVDLNQLIQKFLYGAVAFSQAADDYLDADKGLLADNTKPVEKDGSVKPYTNLEHQWDEGFGYFGAARNYMNYEDIEIAGKGGRDGFSKGYNDANADGKINFNSEYNFGNSTNAAKRDLGTADKTNPTDLTKEAFEAFYAGRKLISTTEGAVKVEELEVHANKALLAWEKAIAATVVHYINDTHKDLERLAFELEGKHEEKYEGEEYGASHFTDLAKHWSEMKGFALNFQFNPNSPFYAPEHEGEFARLHTLMGNKPVIDDVKGIEDYNKDLLEARNILKAVYKFDEKNVAGW